MAEKKEMRIENIKKASEILKDGKLDELIKLSHGAEGGVKNFKSKLESKLKELELAKKEREEKLFGIKITTEQILQAVEQSKKENNK